MGTRLWAREELAPPVDSVQLVDDYLRFYAGGRGEEADEEGGESMVRGEEDGGASNSVLGCLLREGGRGKWSWGWRGLQVNESV